MMTLARVNLNSTTNQNFRISLVSLHTGDSGNAISCNHMMLIKHSGTSDACDVSFRSKFQALVEIDVMDANILME